MGFFDSAQEVLDKGVSAAKGAVSGVAVEQQSFVKQFVRMCDDGWRQGWHERNGGNVSYRMTPEDIQSSKGFFYDTPSSWVALPSALLNLAGDKFLVTAAGSYMRNVSLDPASNIGIVELDDTGGSWRIVWGFKGGGVPTSELPSHLMTHAVRKDATIGADRVLYHAHPSAVVAMTGVLPADARAITRALWKAMTECVIAVPKGVSALPWMVPGGTDIARATADAMVGRSVCVWAQHGMFASAPTFDEAFGMIHAVEKAADVWLRTQATARALGTEPIEIPDAGLREIAATYNLPIDESMLD